MVDRVIEVVRDMLSEDNQRVIAREISVLCAQEQDKPNLKRLQRLLKENSKQKANLLESLKVGKASVTATNYVFTKNDRLEKEAAELDKQTAIEEDRHYGLDEVDIMYFLSYNAMVNSIYVYADDDGDHKITIVFNVSNQPPVQVDVSLLDEMQNNGGSYTSRLSPPKKLRKHLFSKLFSYFQHFSLHISLLIHILLQSIFHFCI